MDTMLDAATSGSVGIVRDLTAEIIAAFTDPDLANCETVLVVPTKKKRPKRLRANRVDGLQMLEPEELEKAGECPGGRYFYVTSCEEAIRHLKYWASQKCWAAIDLETGCCLREPEEIKVVERQVYTTNREEAHRDAPPDQEIEITTNCAGEEVYRWTVLDEVVEKKKVYYELADPYNSPIYLASISVEPGMAFVFDMRTFMQEPAFNDAFRAFLTECGLVCHGSIFEQSFFMARWGVTANIVYDTMLVHQLMTAGLDRGSDLGSMMKKYESVELDKQWQKFFIKIHPESPLPNDAIAYSAADVCQLLSMMKKVDAELRKDKALHRVWLELERPLMEWMATARVEGLAVDRDVLLKLQAQFTGDMEEARARFAELCPGVLITSNPQLKGWFETCGIFTDSVDEAALERISKKYDGEKPAEVAKSVLAFRKVAKFVTTYVNPFLNEHVSLISGRVHPFWKQLNTHTGRMACGEPNIQNIPRDEPWVQFRGAIVPPAGYKIAYLDYSQYEVRALADAAGEQKMIDVFLARAELLPVFGARCRELELPNPDTLTELREKKPEKYAELVGPYPDIDEMAAALADLDFHRRTASMLFKVPVTEVTKSQRSKAKTITFALPYGAGPPGVAQQAGITVDEAEQLINDYYASFPMVKNFLERMRQQARKGYTETPSGRKRLYPRPDRDSIYKEALATKQAGGKAWDTLRHRWKSDDPARIALKRVEYQLGGIEREGTNHPIQGCNADATKLATVLAAARLRWLDPRCKIVAWVHDEIILIAPDELIHQAAAILEAAMLEAAARYLKRCPVEVSVSIGERWGK